MSKEQTPQVDWDSVGSIEAGFDETYKFESHGDVQVGTFMGLQVVDTDDGEATAAVITNDNGRIGVWANHDLKGKLRKVEPGQLVRIEYIDDRAVNNLTPMKVYDVKAV